MTPPVYSTVFLTGVFGGEEGPGSATYTPPDGFRAIVVSMFVCAGDVHPLGYSYALGGGLWGAVQQQIPPGWTGVKRWEGRIVVPDGNDLVFSWVSNYGVDIAQYNVSGYLLSLP